MEENLTNGWNLVQRLFKIFIIHKKGRHETDFNEAIF